MSAARRCAGGPVMARDGHVVGTWRDRKRGTVLGIWQGVTARHITAERSAKGIHDASEKRAGPFANTGRLHHRRNSGAHHRVPHGISAEPPMGAAPCAAGVAAAARLAYLLRRKKIARMVRQAKRGAEAGSTAARAGQASAATRQEQAQRNRTGGSCIACSAVALSWIKCGVDLPHKPEVLQMSRELERERVAVLGALLLTWCWADLNTTDGFIPGVTAADIDRVAEMPGLAAALVQCGWLSINPVGKPVGVLFINFARHMGDSAKRRAAHARSQEKYRGNNGKAMR